MHYSTDSTACCKESTQVLDWAPIGLSPLLILTLCGPERVLVVFCLPHPSPWTKQSGQMHYSTDSTACCRESTQVLDWAPIGLSPLLILTLCGPERVLVVFCLPHPSPWTKQSGQMHYSTDSTACCKESTQVLDWAPIGLSPLLILTLCGPERVLVVFCLPHPSPWTKQSGQMHYSTDSTACCRESTQVLDWAPIGLSPLLILTLCGPERVLVVFCLPHPSPWTKQSGQMHYSTDSTACCRESTQGGHNSDR